MNPRPIRIDGSAAYVPLTKGYTATIDASDVPLVEGCNWFADEARRKDGSIRAVYAKRAVTLLDCRQKIVRMHRVLMSPVSDIEVDHINGDGLDNRRGNLRVATRAQNQQNRRVNRNNASGWRGVSWYPRYSKWVCGIQANGKSKTIGYFNCPTAAAIAYAKASAALHGEFGRVA